MGRKLLISLFAGTLINLALITLASALGTPDGSPPSVEDICSNETGAGYGLCNAYCEAMDCESTSPSASATACQKVADKYQEVTNNSHPPCACPMMAYPSFNSLVSNPATIDIPCTYRVDSQQALVEAYGLSSGRAAVFDSYGNYAGNDDTTGNVQLSPEEFELCFNLLSTACGENHLPIDYFPSE